MDIHSSNPEPAEAIKTPPTSAQKNVQVVAAVAIAAGLHPLPIKARSKKPDGGNEWQGRTYTVNDFAPDGNIGLHLTAGSRVVDADLDSEYARRLAPRFLPATEMKYGRASKPVSHWMWRADTLAGVRHTKFEGPSQMVEGKKKSTTLLERRTGDGKQSVIPPSIHESGEPIEYLPNCSMKPTEVNGKTLSRALDKLAVASLIASIWSEGVRHKLALAIPAFMLKTGVDPAVVQEIVGAVAEEYDDLAEVVDRMKAIHDTIEKFEAGGPDTISGARYLSEILGDQAQAFMAKVCKWLGLRLMKPDAAHAAKADATRANGKPTIMVGVEQYEAVSEEAYRLMVAGNYEPVVEDAVGDAAPIIFQRSAKLQRVRLVRDPDHDVVRPTIELLDSSALTGRLMRSANWFVWNDRTGPKPIVPPTAVVNDIASRKTWEGIPYLRDVTETPVITRTGDIIVTPGYQKESLLWYHPTCPTDVPELSERPDEGEIVMAAVALMETIRDFCFEDAASRCHAWAFLMLPFMRDIIDGPTPLHLIDASTRGSGKGLLAEVCARLATGNPPRALSWHTEDPEMRKSITALLIANGGGVAGYDNVSSKIDSPVLAKLLTDVVWTERVLGVSSMAGGSAGLPIRVTWYATGNNLAISGEMMRRSSHIRLVPDVEMPENRTGFLHDPLVPWVLAERGRLVHAALTLARAAFQAREAGKLPKVPAWGSYGAYAELVGGLTKLAGIDGWQKNRDALATRVDSDTGPIHALFIEWWAKHETAEVSALTVAGLDAADGLDGVQRAALIGPRATQTAVGLQLQKQVDRVVAGFQLRRRVLHGRTLYRLEWRGEGAPPEFSDLLMSWRLPTFPP